MAASAVRPQLDGPTALAVCAAVWQLQRLGLGPGLQIKVGEFRAVWHWQHPCGRAADDFLSSGGASIHMGARLHGLGGGWELHPLGAHGPRTGGGLPPANLWGVHGRS